MLILILGPSMTTWRAVLQGLPAGSRMVDTADGPMMLVPILPPAGPAQPDASRSSGS